MLFMPWDTAFETGITEIDQQHRWLVDTTNELHQRVQARCQLYFGTLNGLLHEPFCYGGSPVYTSGLP